MNVTLKQLRVFAAVARSRSFAEACGLVNLSQPAISIALKNLEDNVGGELIARSTRTLSLTPEGEAFYLVVQRLLAEFDEALVDVHNSFAMRRGKLAVAAMPSFASNLLPIALVHYRDKYPDINVTIHDVVAEDLVKIVRNGRVEIGISFDPGEAEDLIFQTLFDDQFVAVLPKEHKLVNRSAIDWRDLQTSPFIALQHPSSIRRLIEQSLAAEEIHIPVNFETHQLATIGRMVSVGLGVSAMPALCTSQMQELGAVCKPLGEPLISRRVGILFRKHYPLSVPAQKMLVIMQKTLASHPNQ